MGLERIFRPGYRYAKAGVMLLDVQPAGLIQQTLLLGEISADAKSDAAASRLMQALDAVNHRFGRGTLITASAGLGNEQRMWSMKQERLTPGYTTDWDGLAVVRA